MVIAIPLIGIQWYIYYIIIPIPLGISFYHRSIVTFFILIIGEESRSSSSSSSFLGQYLWDNAEPLAYPDQEVDKALCTAEGMAGEWRTLLPVEGADTLLKNLHVGSCILQ